MRLVVALLLSLTSCAIAAKDVTVNDVDMTCPTPPANDFSWGPRGAVNTAQIENTTAAVTSVVFTVTGPTGEQRDCIDTTGTLVSGNVYEWSCFSQFAKHSYAGTYKLTRMTIADDAGELANVYYDDMAADPTIGAQECEMVNTSGVATLSVGTVSQSPTSVNGTAGDSVLCEVPQTGTSDVIGMKCAFRDPSGDLYECGGPSDTCTFVVEPGAELGYWLLDEVVITDAIGQKVSLDRNEVPPGSNTWLDVNTTGGGAGGTGGAPAGFDYCGQIADDTVTNDAYFNAAQTAGTEMVYFNLTARADVGGAFVGVGETNTDTLAAFNAAVEFYDSGSEKYFRAKDGAAFAEPRVKLNWVANVWYKIRIEIDRRAGTYYAEVADCDGGDDYYWIGSALDLDGTPASHGYVKAYAPSGGTLQMHTDKWDAWPVCFPADCSGGSIEVDVSPLTPGCGTPTWTIEPGGYTGTGNWGPTALADRQYLAKWESTYDCVAPDNDGAYPLLEREEYRVGVFNDAHVLTPERVQVPPLGYAPRTEVGLYVQVSLDGDNLSAPPVGAWTVVASGDFDSGDFSDSGSGDQLGTPIASPTYVGLEYTITCAAESGYTVTTPPSSLTASPNYWENTLNCNWDTN